MASLRDREVAVSEKNDTRMGPSGRRARSADSFYLLVGGSRDTYDVTVNFESKNGHWCETTGGRRCHGNGNGKGQKFGPPQRRNKRDPQQWCKHVQAALAATEALAEAQERTARAFGKVEAPAPVKVEVKAKPPVPAFPSDAQERLAEIEAEAAKLRDAIKAEGRREVRAAVLALIEEHGHAAVEDAIKAA